MPELTPERLREIEVRVKRAIDGYISSVIVHIGDSEALLAALKQVTEERDRFAAVVDKAREITGYLPSELHPKIYHFIEWALDQLGSHPAACLKARDAEKDRRISELEDYCGKAALAIAKSDEDEAYHQLYCAIVQDLNLSAEEQALRMNQAMGLTGEQSNAVLSMMREATAQENR